MNPEYSASHRPVDAWTKNGSLTRLAEKIQPVVQGVLEGDSPVARTLKNVLHGTIIGHPLHPMLTDIPIGAWTVTVACDALDICGNSRCRAAADAALAVGIAGAVGAAVTGLADWSDTKDEPQRTGMLHAILNSAALTCYLASGAARRADARGLGIFVAFAGYALLGTAAYLGGELSLGMQLGVKHTAVPIDPPRDFMRVLDASALAPGGMQQAELATIPVLVTKIGDRTCAVSGVCTHRGAPLAEGERDGDCIRCPWHGSVFSLEDGRVHEGPATFPLAQFETRIAGGAIELRPDV
jgi:nitrite reductase/ring-hydroxylating ferredoxin subunit/uncharacterized membrane protein